MTPRNKPGAENRFTFSRATLDSLPTPTRRRALYYDDVVRSLALRVYPTGAKSFLVYRKFKGRPARITLGLFDAGIPETRELEEGAKLLDLLGARSLNVRMARKLAVAVTAQLDVGVNPAVESSVANRKSLTLGELFARYAAYLRTKGKKSVPALTWTWERYLGHLPPAPKKPHGAKRAKAPGAVNWEHRPVKEIRHDEVSRLWLGLGEKVGRTTANRVLGLLHAIYEFGKKHRLYRGENPAEGNDKFQLISRERFLQKDELPKFFEALDAVPAEQDFADFIRLSLFTGARRGNLLAMRWNELNLDGARWTVSGELMKNGEPLTIPLVEDAVLILRRRKATRDATAILAPQDDTWVFPGDSASGHMGPPRKEWARLLKRAGLADLRLHDLRRSLGSWMSNTGAATVMTMRALGHRSIKAALVYQQLESAPVREAMQRAVTAISQASQGAKTNVVQMPTKTGKDANHTLRAGR